MTTSTVDADGSNRIVPHTFPIVGIGASAGGFDAFRKLLEVVPPDTGMAFLLVQHLDPTHESRLPHLLARVAHMPVAEAANAMEVRPNHVYVIPPNTYMALAGGKLQLTPRTGHRPHLPIDHLFRSLAEEQEARAIAVVLSGTGSDGALGLCEIKARGGITFAQDERTAAHAGMPHSAIEAGSVDFVLPPDEIGRRLPRLGAHPYLGWDGPAPEMPLRIADDQFKEILETVRLATGVDFSQYRDTTIRRRVMRRMAVRAHESPDEYARRLKEERAEVEALHHDLLINVTSFFRDPELFEALKTHVLPEIARRKPAAQPIRVWVPGCSTGQEAYSLAITVIEFYGEDYYARPPVQIFATDLSDPVSLERARAGVYPASIEGEVSPERLRRFFTREDHVYRIDKSIRDMCVFARQNLIADPPFSHLDVVSCRNVLIYLSTALQKRLMPTFHYALDEPGYLVLGTAETTGESSELFDLVDRAHKIYRKRASGARPALYFAEDYARAHDPLAARRSAASVTSGMDFRREADRILLGRYSPPGVLVNANLDVLQYRGRTGAYLEPPPGEPTTNLLKLAREGLFIELRNAIAEAKKTGNGLLRRGLRVRDAGQPRDVDVEVIPVRPPGTSEACFLVLFHEAGVPGAGLPPQAMPDAPDESRAGEMAVLRQELASTKDYLQSLVEQQDAANEKLRSANEEILSSNEELQSSNEELETAKEELQSANEELATVNEQLQNRNLELSQTNDDLTNLLSSTNIPLVMVAGDLRIRRFTPSARKVLHLVPGDVGRPIGDLRAGVQGDDLEAIVRDVIAAQRSHEREIRVQDGRWHELRVYPYRTGEDRVEGAVVVLVDVDQRKRAEEALRDADRRKDEFLATLAHELRNPIAPIRNAVEIMRRAGDAGTLEQAREVLQRQVGQLSRIVEDLVDVSRIVERKIELRKERIAVRTIFDTAVETCRSIIEANAHRLQVNLSAEPLYVYVDAARMSQAVINLLSNAAKFTKPGGDIWLSAERAGRQPGDAVDGDHVVIRVRDSGVGLRGDLIPHVFDMFVQGDRAADSTRAGLGVGLSLVRSIVQMHGGNVTAHSAGPTRGSEFTVRLPVASDDAGAGQDAMPRVADNPHGVPRRFPVVDDNRDHVESLGMLLQLMGHEVRLAYDGAEALEIATAFVPEIALIDIGLPGINGYEVARRFKAQPRLRDAVLVAQTGWGQEEDRRRSKEAGFDYHLVKPVTPESIGDVLRALDEK